MSPRGHTKGDGRGAKHDGPAGGSVHGLVRSARRAIGVTVVAFGLFIAGQAATTPVTAHAAPAQPWRLGVVGHAR